MNNTYKLKIKKYKTTNKNNTTQTHAHNIITTTNKQTTQ